MHAVYNEVGLQRTKPFDPKKMRAAGELTHGSKRWNKTRHDASVDGAFCDTVLPSCNDERCLCKTVLCL